MLLLSIIIISILVSIDYFSKSYLKSILLDGPISINDFLTFQLIKNKGIAFSILNSDSMLINILLLIIILAITYFIASHFYRNINNMIMMEKLSFILIISGAIGNLLDRFIYGYVIDFIFISYKSFYFPAIFNVADIYITIGAVILIILLFKKDESYNKI